MNSPIKIILLIFCALLFTDFIISQTIPQSTYSDMKWRLVGPHRGGWATVADGIPDQPNVYYFGGAGGGVWKTTDAGRTWVPKMNNESAAAIGALAIAPSDPNIIYAGTGQVALRYDILDGDGVFKTTDGGETWENTGLKETKYIGSIVVHPENPNRVVVAALGPVFGDSKARGIYITNDGGKNWKNVLFVNDSTGGVDLASDPLNPNVIYAALWQMRIHPWLDYYIPQRGLGSGIYKSEDGGEHWKKLSGNGLPGGPLGRIGLATFRGSGGKIVYASIDGQGENKGLYRSDDGGMSWNHVNKDGVLASSYFSRITIDPNDPDKVYVMGQSIRISTDGGKSFKIFKGAPGGDDYHLFWINPKDTQYMITAADQGTVISVNGGQSWSSWYNQPTGQFYHLGADDQFPYRVYAGQQDNGTISMLSRGPYGVIEERDWHPVGADERDYDLPKPGDPNTVFGSGLGGRLVRFDEITRQSAEVSPYPHSTYAAKPNTVKYRYSWITPIAFSPLGKHSLYFGAQYLFKSDDDAEHWEIISPDLSRKTDDAKNCDDPSIEEAAGCGFGVVWDISPSPVSENMIWIGTDDGLIQLTKDGGKSWNNVTPPSVPLWSRIDAISPSVFSDNTAYVAVNTRRLNKFSPLILKTHDGGKTWQTIINGLPSDEYVNVVRADTEKKGLLYAGTNRSIYVSFNDGENWQPLRLNFPTTSVRDLLVHHGDLIACTMGRGIWILDDLAPLREISEKTAGESVQLFKPAQAWRIRGNENHDTPWPPSTPLGQNPPNGAIIDYWLKDASAGVVTLTIKDEAGNVVREYSSTDAPEYLNAYRYFDERWMEKAKVLSKSAGMHRFTWDIRYPRPKSLSYDYTIAAVWNEGTPIDPRGPIALPGNYTVTLSVNGTDYMQPLVVKMDPRINTTVEALKKQLELSTAVRKTLAEVVNLHSDIAKLLDGKATLPAATEDVLKEMRNKLSAVGDILANLVSAVQSADAAPTQGQKELYGDSKKQYDEILEQWNEVKN